MSELVVDVFLFKSEDSLAGAVSEFVNGRYGNCANRAYYACFQAAVAALVREGIGPQDRPIGGVTTSFKLSSRGI